MVDCPYQNLQNQHSSPIIAQDISFEVKSKNPNYDGHVSWKIDSVLDNINLAESGNQPYLKELCYTNRGYQLRFELYLDSYGGYRGEGIVSLACRLVGSADDDKLSWPFHGRFTIKVINFRKPKMSLVETVDIVSDRLEENFQRPVNYYNPGFKIVNLINKASLLNDGFVLDDGMCVEITIQEY